MLWKKEYNKLFTQNDFDISLVRNFTGTLLLWLVHHVINANKRIVTDVKETIYKAHLIGDIFCEIKIKGKTDAVVVFSIPKETALNSIKIIIGSDY